jgi:hypothetical protein
MEKYLNLSGKSGVEEFEIGADYIKVKFKNKPRIYTYNYNSAGQHHIEKMKTLARVGRGLSTYIARNIKDKYVR